ncbi:Neurochondrin-domain-containing protein [Pseudomassariella vexata]|uniref:Neurochondrin-domain-containing protein n=1 Tax=Pseudomassariella vexata TaxID=1141098 RepID=A0A1Y2DJ64_9PEZI|nr:Neurochondrin-domain-containing protein [Pseudomassariella vexata]ORY59216.1 Neurochondrin-domain-containing protein [Pseudomassariella vexata]
MEKQSETNSPYKDKTIPAILKLMKAKDDTTRLVGLGALRSLLDNEPELQRDNKTLAFLWDAVSHKFLDRLLRTKDPYSRDIAVNVIRAFAQLLPNPKPDSLLRRLPNLVQAMVPSSEESMTAILQTLVAFVNSPEGNKAFLELDDWTPLIENAPNQDLVHLVFTLSWLSVPQGHQTAVRGKIDEALSGLVAAFKGQDAIPLMERLGQTLGLLPRDCVPQDPSWLKPLVQFIHDAAFNKRITPEGRHAYTCCATALLMTYGERTCSMLFTREKYLFISLVLVDIRASMPSLLSKRGTPGYEPASSRVTFDLVIMSEFIKYLLDQADKDEPIFQLSADQVLEFRKSAMETLYNVVEYLGDYWDAIEAERAGGSEVSSASRIKGEIAPEDGKMDTSFVVAALGVLSVWLPEDDSTELREKVDALPTDLFLELYQIPRYQDLVLNVIDLKVDDDGSPLATRRKAGSGSRTHEVIADK